MKLNFVEKRIENKYDNESAMNTLKVMMKRGEQLVVKFFTSKDNFPCAWIESKKISGFKLILNQEGLNWLRNYLQTGEIEDFGFDPNKQQLSVRMKTMIFNLQFSDSWLHMMKEDCSLSPCSVRRVTP